MLNTEQLRNPALKDYASKHLDGLVRIAKLGTPILATADYVTVSANMKVGTYTIAHQPDVPRNITVTHTTVAVGADVLGTITILGTDCNNKVISEVITPLAGAVATGLRAFKTITSITGAGWVIAGGNDTITIGVGAVLGLPFPISSTEFCYGVVGTANVVGTAVSDVELSKNTVDLSAGTYDGSKKVFAILSE